MYEKLLGKMNSAPHHYDMLQTDNIKKFSLNSKSLRQ